MKVIYRSSFVRDSKKAQPLLQNELAKVISALIAAEKFDSIKNVKKMVGYKDAYRIRVEDYWIGFYYENEVIELSRFLPRKDIYKKFP